MKIKKLKSVVTAFFLAMLFTVSPLTRIPVRAEETGVYTAEVNVTENVVTVFLDGTPIRAFLCSTGSATPTSGTYATSTKARWCALFGGVHGQYAVRIVGSILFHSVPYLRYGDPSSLEYWEYDKLGTAASMGCVRMCVEDAKWMYETCPSGMNVTFVTEGKLPLGKPEGIKISSAPEDMRGWDPTDPDEENPWKIYTSADIFDAEYYYGAYEDVRAAVGSFDRDRVTNHWLKTGIREGRRGCEGFDAAWYRHVNADLYAAFGDDYPAYFRHYVTMGKGEGRETVEEKHPFIKGKCQMPNPGGGYLIGFESFDNPNQSYRYEMLILDCTLLAQDLPAWIYTTGQCVMSEGNALWTVWQPQYGYYWTLFRLYDESGTMIDEACYGFENIR